MSRSDREKGEVLFWKVPVFVVMAGILLFVQFMTGLFFIPVVFRLLYSEGVGKYSFFMELALWTFFVIVGFLALLRMGKLFFKRNGDEECTSFPDILPVIPEEQELEQTSIGDGIQEEEAFFTCHAEVKALRKQSVLWYYRFAGIGALVFFLLLICRVDAHSAFAISGSGAMMAYCCVSFASTYKISIKGLRCPSCGSSVRFRNFHSVGNRRLFVCSRCGKSSLTDIPSDEKEYI